MNQENLGAADRIVAAMLSHADHLIHNRPGFVRPDPSSPIGVKWAQACIKKGEDGTQHVYTQIKVGKTKTETLVGEFRPSGVYANGVKVGEYRNAGMFPEVVQWMYSKIAEVFALDNEFAAKWASYAFKQERRDLKVVLAAFMLVQNRKGDSIKDEGRHVFSDEDYRDVGEAMVLTRLEKRDFNPKMLLQVWEVLRLVAPLNRELGFSKSTKNPQYGRLVLATQKYIKYRETNEKMMTALVKAGFKSSINQLAQLCKYKPQSEDFFRKLRWKQSQSKHGKRQIGLDITFEAAESWEGLTETQICEKITETRHGWKRITGLLPASVGLTPAIMAAALEVRALSDNDLIILTPTLEDLGLFKHAFIESRWEEAIQNAENQRAANIAARVKNTDTAQKLQNAADAVMTKAVQEVTKGLRIYFIVDISGSMGQAIDQAKTYLTSLLSGFPLDRIHVSVFNTMGKEIVIKHSSKIGVETAFKGIGAGGGTDYGSGVYALMHHAPKEDEDVLMMFVGDEEAPTFEPAVRASGLRPSAFGLVKLGNEYYTAVRSTAALLGIPCFKIDNSIFSDPYAITRTLQNLIKSTPLLTNRPKTAMSRKTLAEEIAETPLLTKPVWA